MRICIFAPDNTHSLEISGLLDSFAEANLQVVGQAPYELSVFSEKAGPLRCSSGLRILPDRTIHEGYERFDTVMVAGPPGVPHEPSKALIAWLGKQVASARRYGSVCTGAFFLGAAGLIDGRNVTTHWQYGRELAAAFPKANVLPDRIFVRDGPLFTSAGVTSCIDLALALIEEDLGAVVALAVARALVVFLKRPGGQAQFSVQLAAQSAIRSPIRRAHEWIRDNLKADLSIGMLAKRAAMSERNFSRVFRSETGMTAAAFVDASRLDAARRLLEQTNLPLARIAQETGFTSADALRRVSIRMLGIPPSEYRRRFRSTEYSATVSKIRA